MIIGDWQMESIFAAFPKILEQFEANPEAREAFLFAAWHRCVGEKLNEHTVPFELADSRLRVAVANLMWQRHLETLAGQILAKLNSTLGRNAVSFIEFFIDEEIIAENRRIKNRSRMGNLHNTAESEGEIASVLIESASAINNEELRNAFLHAAQSCLARNDRMIKAK